MADDLEPHRWSEADRIFDEALERAPEDRRAYVREACGGDEILLAAVLRLLDAHRAAEGFLEEPARIPAKGGLEDLVPPSETEPSLVGQSVGPYRIVSLLGRGGMGAVFLAERADGRYEAQVALKFLHVGVAGDELSRRFMAERRIMGSLAHPNIARLLDAGETSEGWPYLVMEHVEGEPITAYADRHRLTVDQRLRLFFQVCRAVEYAHGRMVIHRDLKPSNVLVDAQGLVKLLDFGIAKLLDAAAPSDEPLTRPGSRILTPEYAAPEQLRGEPVTAATDVHQLGALLYRLLAGRRPYIARESTDSPSSTLEVQRAILQEEPDRPSSSILTSDPAEARTNATARGSDPEGLRRRLRGDLDAVLLTTLRKDPEHRYPSATALRKDLERHLDGFPVRARPPTLRYRARKLLRRRWGWAAAAVGLLLVGSGVLYGQAAHQAQLQAERDRAVAQEERARATADFLVSLFHDVDPAQGAADTLSAISLVDRGTGRIQDAFGDDPGLRATLLGAVGRVHLGLGTGDAGWGLLLEADSLLSEVRGPEHPERLALLEDLAWSLIPAQQFERAQPLWEELLERRRQEARGGGRTERLALAAVKRGAARNLAGLGDRGEPEEMLRMAERAVEILEEEGEAGSLAHLRAQTDLAASLRATGDPEGAETLYREAVERHESGEVVPGSLWEEGVGVAGGGVIRPPNLAGSFPSSEDRERRWAHERRAHLAEVYNALGVLLAVTAEERAEEIRATYRRAYEVAREAWGENHDRTLNAHRNLAAGYSRVGDAQRYLELREEARQRKVDRFGPRHWRVGRTHADQARAYRDELEDPIRAEEHYREALAIYTEGLGELHEWSSRARMDLALSLADAGRHGEGVALLEAARGALEEADPSEVRASLELTLEGLRAIHRDAGNEEGAREVEDALAALHPD